MNDAISSALLHRVRQVEDDGPMDWTLAVAVGSLVVAFGSLAWAVVGTRLSNERADRANQHSQEANRYAREANERAVRAEEAALWSRMQAAVQRLIGFDPTMEAVGPRLQDMRIAGIDLIDGLPDWTGLDEWLEAERHYGAAIARQVMNRAKPDDTVDQRLASIDPYMQWAQVLSQNLRLFRRDGYNETAARKLREHIERQTVQLYEKNGWEQPDRSGFEPLDLDGDE